MDKDDDRRLYGCRPYGRVTEGFTRTSSSAHDAKRDKLEADTSAFLAAGGEITHLENGQSGVKPTKHIRFAKHLRLL